MSDFETASAWLTPLQTDFLQHFFASSIGVDFFLTGGTALAAFYLHHRHSEDLDLFTLDTLPLRETDNLIPQLAEQLGCHISHARRTEHFRRYFLELEEAPPLKIDLVQDFGPQYGEHLKVGDIIVDSLENIAVNKLTAILGRTEPKDFVDLAFILQAGYDFDELRVKAKQKDLGMEDFFLAGSLLQVRNLHYLPETYPPITSEELEQIMTPLVNRLVDSTRP
jgi:predicted nucleotidyltransferase component of viral defense system